MKNNQILIYKWGGTAPNFDTVRHDLTTTIWKPKYYPSIPRRLPKKYIMWWFYHHLRIFQNRQFSVRMTWKDQSLAQFFCTVPAHFKWSFMSDEDVQITYVITEPPFRGEGIGFYALGKYLSNYKGSGALWYVTNQSNIPSQKLAQKLGFKLAGVGQYRKKVLGLVNSLYLLR